MEKRVWVMSDVVISEHEEQDDSWSLKCSVWLPQSVDEVFKFFADAGNLQVLTPPWLHFRILTPLPIDMRDGALIDYRLRLRFVPIRWRTEITDWHPPHRFVDRQLEGPYRQWVHTHTFEPLDGGTLVRDQVTYSAPGGTLVHDWFVGPELKRIFEYRHEVLLKEFDVGAKTSVQAEVK